MVFRRLSRRQLFGQTEVIRPPNVDNRPSVGGFPIRGTFNITCSNFEHSYQTSNISTDPFTLHIIFKANWLAILNLRVAEQQGGNNVLVLLAPILEEQYKFNVVDISIGGSPLRITNIYYNHWGISRTFMMTFIGKIISLARVHTETDDDYKWVLRGVAESVPPNQIFQPDRGPTAQLQPPRRGTDRDI